MVSYYTKILRSLEFTAASTRAEKTKSFLATSPVKLFSSLWNGGTTAATPDSIISTKQPMQPSLHRNNSFHSIQGSIRGRDDRSFVDEDLPDNPLMRLEQAFSVYVGALQARKGSIISKHVLGRHNADELLVNELYNKMIENPFEAEVGSEISTETLFVAFENFLRIAWTGQMGPVMSIQSLDTLLDRANRRAPGDFADFVNYLFAEMAPQNRRAFARIIKLLAELLDGCANDGDRGALTLAFAELLVNNDSASNYINLLDRLVEDCDRIFRNSTPEQSFNFGNSTSESVHSMLRKETSLTGSVAANTSSLRRKLGLDMFKRPKEDRPSVWRSLSRHRNPATGEAASFSKATMQQARYIDDDSLPRRGGNGGSSYASRPGIIGTFDEPPRPVSSHRLDFPLDTIGEPKNEAVDVVKNIKKKRRSSLSDLKMLLAAATLHDDDDEEAEKSSLPPLQTMRETSGKLNTGPKSISQSTTTVTIQESASTEALRQKENITDPSVVAVQSSPSRATDVLNSSPRKPIGKHTKALSVSSIPTLRPGRLAETGGDLLSRGGSASPTRATQKLRLQSAQKLRDRMQLNEKAIDDTSSFLKHDLSKIGEEIAGIDNSSLSVSETSQLQSLAACIDSLEANIPKLIQELQDKQNVLQKEMETTVKASESKLRAIDQLHKEVTAENELLYEKFNDELGRIVKALKGKGKEDREELMIKMKEQADETAKVKKENARLKREIVSLRTAMRAAE